MAQPNAIVSVKEKTREYKDGEFITVTFESPDSDDHEGSIWVPPAQVDAMKAALKAHVGKGPVPGLELEARGDFNDIKQWKINKFQGMPSRGSGGGRGGGGGKQWTDTSSTTRADTVLMQAIEVVKTWGKPSDIDGAVGDIQTVSAALSDILADLVKRQGGVTTPPAQTTEAKDSAQTNGDGGGAKTRTQLLNAALAVHKTPRKLEAAYEDYFGEPAKVEDMTEDELERLVAEGE
jgi:hypothetical protein